MQPNNTTVTQIIGLHGKRALNGLFTVTTE